MVIDKDIYELLAKVISYPDEQFNLYLDQLCIKINLKYPQFNEVLKYFYEEACLLKQDELEEFYIRTFLLEPVSSLDIGFILFGMDSKRNEFLVNMQREQMKVRNDTGIELADYLPNILTLLTKMKDLTLRNELTYSILIPAVREIIYKFEENQNFYRFILKLILNVLETDFKGLKFEQIDINKNLKF